MGSNVLLSREMSYFLLSHNGAESTFSGKQVNFGIPCIEALILYDSLYVDPSIGLYSDFVHESLRESEFFRTLKKTGVVKLPALSDNEFEEIIKSVYNKLSNYIERRRDGKFTSVVPKFDYNYLLESPWSVFVRETELVLDIRRVERLENKILYKRANANISPGMIPFIVSAILAVDQANILNIPVLLSPLTKPFIDDISKFSFIEINRHLLAKNIANELFRFTQNWRKDMQKVTIPSFSAICTDGARNKSEILERALEIRNLDYARVFRKKINELVEYTANESDEQIRKKIRTEIDEAADCIVREARPDLKKSLKRITLSFIITSPITLIFDNILLGIGGNIGATITQELIHESIKHRKYGWLYYLLELQQFPRSSI